MQILKDNVLDVSSIPINGGKKVIHSVGPLPACSIIDVRGQAELTNNYQFNIGVGRYICVGDSPDDIGGTKIVPAVMDNATPDTHHHVLSHSNLAEGDFQGKFINFVAYAVTTSYQGAVPVHQNYGFLTVGVVE